MKKSALITGGTGFIGSHLVRKLINNGWDVHVVVRSSSDTMLIDDFINSIILHIYDGTYASLHDAFNFCNPDIVFHLASYFVSEHVSGDIDSLVESNVKFGVYLVEASVAHGCCKFVNTGTLWQNYQGSEYCPVNLYAATKQAFEDILKYYVDACDLRLINLKICDTYGPNDPRPKLLNLLKKAAETGLCLEMSPGEQLIDLVHVDDVVEAFMRADELLNKMCKSGMETYRITSGNYVTLKNLVKKIELELNQKINVLWGKKSYRKREVMVPCQAIEIMPGWVAQKQKRFF